MAKCKECGTEIKKAKECFNCGTRVKASRTKSKPKAKAKK